ncbi:MAG: hypothetical protein AAB617_02765 [Patescibacteria group bacterium]
MNEFVVAIPVLILAAFIFFKVLTRNSFMVSSDALGDSAYFDSTWNPSALTAKRRFGSSAEAMRTLHKLSNSLGGNRNIQLRKTTSYLWELIALESPGILGNPEDVSYIIPPRHSVGYAIYTSEDRKLVCEVMEGLESRVRVLFLNGKIVAADSCFIMRSEHHGNVHAI